MLGNCMAVQDRADGTRRLIMDAAAEVFGELGYGSATLADVIQRAGVSRGTFTYHFPSKDSLAVALVRYSHEELFKKGFEAATESASALENLIRATFAQQNLILRDPKIRIGTRLGLVAGDLSPEVNEVIRSWTAYFDEAVRFSFADGDLDGDLDGDVDASKLAYALWCSIAGNHFLWSSAGMSAFEGLALVWDVTLRGLIPAESAEFFQLMVRRVAAQYDE